MQAISHVLNVQGVAPLPTAAAHSLPGIRSSSLQQSKDTRTLAAPEARHAHAAEQLRQQAMTKDTAHSPVAEQQVTLGFASSASCLSVCPHSVLCVSGKVTMSPCHAEGLVHEHWITMQSAACALCVP